MQAIMHSIPTISITTFSTHVCVRVSDCYPGSGYSIRSASL